MAICGEWSVVKGKEERKEECRKTKTKHREKTKVNDVTYKDMGIEKR